MAAMDELITAWSAIEAVSGPTEARKAEALQAVLDMAMPKLEYGQHVSITDLLPKDIKAVPMPPYLHDIKKPRGIKALIPVPETMALAEARGALPKGTTQAYTEAALHSLKPKRKRRTKAEMAAARVPKSNPFNVDKATDEQVAAEIDRLAKAQITPEKAIADVIESAIKPHFATRAPGPDGFKHFVVFMSRPDGSNLSSNGTKWKDALNAAGCRTTKVEMTLLNAANRQFDLMVM